MPGVSSPPPRPPRSQAAAGSLSPAVVTGTDAEIEFATRDLAAAERAEGDIAEQSRQITEAVGRERLAEVDRMARDYPGRRGHDPRGQHRYRRGWPPDLKVSWSRPELLQLTGATDTQLPNPLEWRLAGYWPSAPVSGGNGPTYVPCGPTGDSTAAKRRAA